MQTRKWKQANSCATCTARPTITFKIFHLSFFLVRIQWTHTRSVSTVCSDVKVLAENISDGYRHRAKSGTEGDEEVLLRRNITYRSQLGYSATGHLKFKWLNQY